MITTHHITTSMGNTRDRLAFLNENEMDNFNNIGYSGKTLDGKKTTREEYLNSLNRGEFVIEQTQYDNGSFEEKFTIIRVSTNSNNQAH